MSATDRRHRFADSLQRKRRRWLYRWLSAMRRETMPAPSAEPVDVVIPVIEKDLDVLPLCLEGVRRQMTNPLRTIYLVGPGADGLLRRTAATLGCEFVDERDVLGYSPRDIDGAVTPDGTDRRGWIYQQLLKLAGNVGMSRHFLVIDSDHILVAPHTFVTAGGRSVLYCSKEYHGAYFRAIRRLMGGNFAIAPLSFVAHKMMFDRERLSDLRHALESHGDRWDRVILGALDMTEGASPFSEYELYGNFLPVGEKVTMLWRQKALAKAPGALPAYDTLVERYGRHRLSVTFPDYKKKL